LSGRLIQTLEQQSVTDKFVRVLWDGRDHDGDEIANGVYFYRLMAKTQDGRFTSEEVGKMAVAK
jgi:flagellar hook assembly protein FlgD